jgi:ferredoxin--NADP+ reductase
MPDSTNSTLNAVVTRRIEVAPGLVVIQVTPDGWELPDFEAGQYTVLGLPGSAPRLADCDPDEKPPDPDKLIRRAYSIASSSQARNYLEFYVALVRSGALTPRLLALKVGGRIFLGKKITGVFTLDQAPPDANLVLISTGTGLAPYISMLRTQLAADNRRRVVVIHGARHSWDLGYQAELVALASLCPHFDYIPLVSRPAEEPIPWNGRTGYCQDVWKDRVIDRLWGIKSTPENTRIFLCGNPAMIEDLLVLLGEEGFRKHTRREPGEIYMEKYW